jgi:hypothetical protein
MTARHILRGRLLGITFLVVVIVVTADLIAGYGVAVGLGALAGLLLAFAVGLFAFFSTWRGNGQMTFGGSSGTFARFGENADLNAQPERIHDLTEILPIDLGRVRTVVPALSTSVANGFSVEMIAVELCEAGLALNLDVNVAPGLPHPASMARVSITDDVGTPYRASAQGQGSMPSRLRITMKAIPAAPPAARVLDVRIEEFVDPFPGMGEAVTGPWTFSITLPRE